jgi:hypothetical protein
VDQHPFATARRVLILVFRKMFGSAAGKPLESAH